MSQRRTFYYKGVRVNAFGFPILGNSSRDSKKEKYSRKKKLYNIAFLSPFKKGAPKNLIVMYDISHNLRKERDWLRRHLVKFDYKMIQKSVWVGPSPLPKYFVDYLKEIKIRDNLKTFKLASGYKF